MLGEGLSDWRGYAMAQTVSSLAGLGLYTTAEAARYIGVDPAKLRRWAEGYTFGPSEARRRSSAVVHLELGGRIGEPVLTFRDLMELHFVRFFRETGVTMRTIRLAADRAAAQFGTDHPFAVRRFMTDGKTIFAALEPGDRPLGIAEERWTEDLKTGQMVFTSVISPFFDRVEFGPEYMERYWPMGRERGIVLDPARAFGRPIDMASGVPTYALYRAVAGGSAVAQVAEWYGVPQDAVTSAVAFERRHSH